MCASFAVIHQTMKVRATMCDKCLVKMEKALNLYNILKEREHIRITFITMYCYHSFVLLLATLFLFVFFLSFFFLFFFFVFLPFLGPLPRHMEVPRLGVKLELLPLAYTVTAMPDLSQICD